jgi:hypothetical protein
MTWRRRLPWLLLVPYVALFDVPLYARAQPVLLGFPFFYWYMFLWIILTAALTGLVYKLR